MIQGTTATGTVEIAADSDATEGTINRCIIPWCPDPVTNRHAPAAVA